MIENEITVLVKEQRKSPRLIALWNNEFHEFLLSGEQTFGRAAKGNIPDICVSSASVSRKHGRFVTTSGDSCYCDIGSSNGTLCNGKELRPDEYHLLEDGDVLRIHGREDTGNVLDTLMIYSTSYHENTVWKQISLNDDNIVEIKIGRQETVTLQDQTVSRHHASFFHASNGWAIIDHDSMNGVRVNNQRISRPIFLVPMDVIWIAGYLFIFTGERLLYQVDKEQRILPDNHEDNGKPAPENSKTSKYMEEDAGALVISIEERNVWHRMRKKTLLKDINLEIPAGNLVLILGGSGAGKTTFMNAVMGYEPAQGSIRYKGIDIYDEYEKMKYEIGYVPQQDLLREKDTVYATLLNAAEMRLPKNLGKGDYAIRVQKTMEILGLERERDSMVGKLSGGQRKRLSIAVEYIGDPSLFFLDEPDSGLDGTMARTLMENLRTIADEGKIVMVISHSPDRAYELWDQVIVLAKSDLDDTGYLVYNGKPSLACDFFGVKSLEQIVKRINRQDEGGDGMADYYIRCFAEQEGR